MPLDEHIPQLDDHTYDSIVTEMRSRIARYTPEWTPVWSDLNDSDPGITMLQVFAWLGEMLAYRMNQVPTLSYLKFLQLLGVELRPAEPAQVQITFPVRATAPTSTVTVPLGTQVIAETPGGGPPLVFEAEQGLVCLKPNVVAVLAYDGYAYDDVTQQDRTAVAYQPFGATAKAGAALLLGFEAAQPFPGTEITMYVWASDTGRTTTAVTCGGSGAGTSPSFPSVTLRWTYWDGFEWAPLTQLKDETLALTRSGAIIVKTPANALATTVVPPLTTPLYWLRLEVVASQYERPPSILAVRTNTMTLTQMETVRAEVLGGSNGRRDQVFTLANTPVLAGSLQLQVDQGSGPETWQQVDDFYASGPDAQVYVLDRTTGQVRFGDGFHGAIPIANVTNPGANVVAAVYRYGGGTQGNVAAGKLHALRNAVDGIDENGVVNLAASYGGQDEETLDQAKQRAPASIRSRCRAVTDDDFEYFATSIANIARARALPLHHPDFPGVAVPGVVTVIVVPRSDDPRPMPSEGTLRTVCAYLDSRRLLTTEVYVAPPTYQLVSVTVELVAADTADLAQVQRDVDQALLDYFHPLRGGEEGTGWPFGGTIAFSRVFHRVLSVPGVASVTRLVIALDGQDAPECRDVPIDDDALVYSTQHQVSVGYQTSVGGVR